MKIQIITISILIYISIFANGKSVIYAPADTVRLEFRDITHIVSVDLFESIKAFVLANGDKETYSNMYGDNPHYSFDGFESYLNPDIGQFNQNCDTSKSDFNEIVIRDNYANPQYYFMRIVRKGDIANEQIITYEGMEENKVYLRKSDDHGDMALMINSINKYLEVIKKELVTSVKVIRDVNIYNIAIYPNPANETFSIESAYQKVTCCQLYNSTGKLLKILHIEDGINNYSISELESGIYFIRIPQKDGTVVKKLVKY